MRYQLSPLLYVNAMLISGVADSQYKLQHLSIAIYAYQSSNNIVTAILLTTNFTIISIKLDSPKYCNTIANQKLLFLLVYSITCNKLEWILIAKE